MAHSMHQATAPDRRGTHLNGRRPTPPPRTRATTVGLVEDQQVLVGAIQASMETMPALSFAGAVDTLGASIEFARATRPDVLVCDYRLDDGDIPEVIPDLLHVAPTTKVLVFTAWPDERSLLEAMAAGASGFVDKCAPFREFVDAVRRVAAGEVVVSPRLVPALTRRATTNAVDALSRRELEVLQLLSDGRSTSEIADELILSVNTVRNHIARLMRKLDVRSRLEAVNVGVRRGLIRFDPPR